MHNLRSHESLISFVSDINELNQGTATALMVIQHGKILLEYYKGYHSQLPSAQEVQADSLFNVASVRKSYLGLVVAYAVYEGKIQSIDDLVTTYLDQLNNNIMEGTTIRHLLTHTHGLTKDKEGNMMRSFPPGTNWSYVDVGVNLLGMLVDKVTGKSVAKNLQELVFAPVGFKETGFMTEKNEKLVQVIREIDHAPDWKLGTNSQGDESNLFVSTRELALWGSLHLKKGCINGKQIVPRTVIEMATNSQSPNTGNVDLPLNGYLWFVQGSPSKENQIGDRVPKGSYQIVGVTGSLVLVIPELDLVAVRMYNKYYNYGGDNYLHYLREFGNAIVDCFGN